MRRLRGRDSEGGGGGASRGALAIRVVEKRGIGLRRGTLQENSVILTENELLGIFRRISEEIARKPKFWVSSEFPRNIPMKYRKNHIPWKIPMNIR